MRSEREEREASVGVQEAVEQLIEEVGVETNPQPLFASHRLRGKMAVVSGGSSGIGRAISLELARAGVHVSFCFLDDGARSRREAMSVVRELRQLEVRAYCRSCDVRDGGDVSRFVAETVEEMG